MQLFLLFILQEEYELVAKSQIKKLTKICAREKMKEAEAAERNVCWIDSNVNCC